MLSPQGISVIIPNYNGRHLLPEILPPLYEALNATGLPYEIIVSDDNSNDDSVSFLKNEFKEIKISEQDVNRGFSPTINKGIFAARYCFLFLLNSDVKTAPDYFMHLLKYFDDPNTFGVMGRIIGWDDDVIQDGGKYPSFHGIKIKTSGNYVPLFPKADDRLLTMYLSGANAFVSRDKIIALGGFDEIFAPFYVEDFELSLRAWRIGWKCMYEHNAVCRHRISSSVKTKSSKMNTKKIYYRNKMFLHALHLQNGRLFLWYLQLIPEMLLYLCIGRFWVLSSVKMFYNSEKLLKRSRERFNVMAKNKKGMLTINEVAENIEASLKQTPLKRF